MLRILQIGCNLCTNGGIENYIINIYENIDRNKYQFVFVIDKNQDKDNYIDKVIELGGEVFFYSSKNPIKKMFEKYRILKKIKCDISHVHVSCGIRAFDGILCKLANRKTKLIFHSHSNIGRRPLKYTLLIPLYLYISDILLACSKNAGKYFFGDNIINNGKFMIALNAVDISKFRYNELARKMIREELKILDDTLVVGFVGRLSQEKNIPYVIDVVASLNKKYARKSMALIIGDGPLKSKLKKYTKDCNIDDYINFLGNKSNVSEYMSSMDVLMLPSTNEGLGIVLIEAQSTSLACFASNVVPEETKISNYIEYFNINDSADLIAERILSKNIIERTEDNTFMISQGYEIKASANKIASVYDSLAN